MDLEEAIRYCRTIGECEVGTIRKMAINRLIDEILQNSYKKVKEVDKEKQAWYKEDSQEYRYIFKAIQFIQLFPLERCFD